MKVELDRRQLVDLKLACSFRKQRLEDHEMDARKWADLHDYLEAEIEKIDEKKRRLEK